MLDGSVAARKDMLSCLKANQQEAHSVSNVELSCVSSPHGSMGFCFCSLSIKKNDVLVEVYTAADYDTGAEYVVDCIVAEKTKGKKTEYLVKWKVMSCLWKLISTTSHLKLGKHLFLLWTNMILLS